MFFLILGVHSVFICIYNCCVKNKEDSKCKKVYQIFNLSIYMGLLLMSNQFVMLSAITEIEHTKFDSVSHAISFIFASVLFAINVSLIVLSLYYFCKHWKNYDVEDHHWFKELFAGLKEKPIARLHMFLVLARRFIYVVFLISFSYLKALPILVTLLLVQIVYYVLIVYLRSYKEMRDNLVNIVNESIFVVLLLILCFYHDESDWKKSIEKAFLGILIANSALVIMIIICKHIKL
jgi:hypothetical protein